MRSGKPGRFVGTLEFRRTTGVVARAFDGFVFRRSGVLRASARERQDDFSIQRNKPWRLQEGKPPYAAQILLVNETDRLRVVH